jgi:dienelactone hydrolase
VDFRAAGNARGTGETACRDLKSPLPALEFGAGSATYTVSLFRGPSARRAVKKCSFPSRTTRLVLGSLLLAGCAASVSVAEVDPETAEFISRQSGAATAALQPDTARFTTETIDWQDPTRLRQVPVRIYLPTESTGPRPLVVFSHGLGGSREGYRYLGRHFAAGGYIAVHIQHVGSDRALWSGNPLALLGRLNGAAQESEALDRVADVKFVLDRLLSGEWAQRIDAGRVIVAGHSYGANTAMLVAGAKVERDGVRLALTDARIRAAILISAPPFYGRMDTRAILKDIAIPTLHITATDDDITIPGYRSGLGDRIEVYDSTGTATRAPKLLAVFKGGAHSMFTDRLQPGGTDLNPIVKLATRDLALKFADRVLARTGNALSHWKSAHAPLIARFESSGELLH